MIANQEQAMEWLRRRMLQQALYGKKTMEETLREMESMTPDEIREIRIVLDARESMR